MKTWGSALAAFGAVALLGAAGLAHAESSTQATTPPKTNDFAASGEAQGPWTVPSPHKTYAFDNKGRWGVKLDLTQPANRAVDWKDVQAGAYFRITPNIRVGGSVGLGDKFAQPQQISPQDTGPRVHVEGAFKF